MNRRIKLFFTLALAAGLLSGLLGASATASAHPAGQGTDPIAVVMAMADAFNAGDADRLRELLDPSFQDIIENPPPGFPIEAASADREAFIRSSAQGIHVTLSNCQLTAPDTVVCDATITGGDLPPLPHPLTEKSTLTVVNGKITRLVETLSEQTLRDFEVLSGGLAPGMPTTGARSEPGMPLSAALLGLLLLTAGLLARRAGQTRSRV